MPNTFDPVPDADQERSTAFLPLEQPGERLETLMDEAELHRGSLREQDGYTIPFREGGSVRIRIEDGEDAADGAGLRFTIKAPTAERREHIESTIAEQVSSQLGDAGSLDWTPVES